MASAAAIFVGCIDTASAAAASFHLSANDAANSAATPQSLNPIEGDTIFTGVAAQTAIIYAERADSKILPSYIFATADTGPLTVNATTDLHLVNLTNASLTVTSLTGTPKSLTLYAMNAEAAVFAFTAALDEAQLKVTKYKIGPISVTAKP